MQITRSSRRARLWLLPTVLSITALTFTPLVASAKSLVDVNSANAKTLETLPGITPTLAGRIIDGRPYHDLSDLKKIKGLSSTKLNAIKDQITFGSSAAEPKAKSTKNTKTTSSAKQTSSPEQETSAVTTEQGTSKAAQNTHAAQTKAVSPTGAASGHISRGETVNINTATLEELDALPGIGPTKAQAIIDYRNEHGPFSSIEDIQKVKGIKEGEFSKLKDYIRVR